MAKDRQRTKELVPCFDKFESLDEVDGVIFARSSSAGVIREGRMLRRCFLPMIAAGLSLLHTLGWLPVMNRYHGIRRMDDGTYEFDISSDELPSGKFRIRARVTEAVARAGHNDLCNVLPPPDNVVRLDRSA